MKTILIITQYYLPGYKGGGPILSISHLVNALSKHYKFKIITSDHDLGEKNSYKNVLSNIWKTYNDLEIYYYNKKSGNIFSWKKLLTETKYDMIYLNGFFAPETRRTLLLRGLSLIPFVPIIIAPRGEFDPGALNLKKVKKTIYIKFANFSKLFRKIFWHATNENEKIYIRNNLYKFMSYVEKNIIIAPNLISYIPNVENQIVDKKQNSSIDIIFLSRISRKKNLHYALNLIRDLKGEVKFDIYGPLEDKTYWFECQKIINGLPQNIKVNYKGEISNEKVQNTFNKYRVFLFPTRGENFGHVIFEALSAGCPVLISDQTPWKNLEEKGIGWDIPLDNKEKFVEVLNKLAIMKPDEYEKLSSNAIKFAKEYSENQNRNAIAAYQKLFELEAQ